MKAEYINSFIKASKDVLTQMTTMDFQVEKPYLKENPINVSNVIIIVGITGEIRGQVVFSMNEITAKQVVSNMMGGMPVDELNDISKSALSELGNMIMGNSATLLFNIGKNIDITPPTLMIGQNVSMSGQMTTVCIPLTYNEHHIELDIFMKE
ncbi:chemotaxis protein CheX [Lutibacter sp. B2]|nr:chemotaxis protein CheX [Lutibacter sp. B2]